VVLVEVELGDDHLGVVDADVDGGPVTFLWVIRLM